MRLLPLALIGTAGYAVYRLIFRQTAAPASPAAFAAGEASAADPHPVRNAGPAAMRSDYPDWDRVDEASDESFPASDPPALH